MTPVYTSKLGFKVHPTNIGAQKIDSTTLKIFKMVLASFQIENKLRKGWLFQETFLLADISGKVALDILFLILSNANV